MKTFLLLAFVLVIQLIGNVESQISLPKVLEDTVKLPAGIYNALILSDEDSARNLLEQVRKLVSDAAGNDLSDLQQLVDAARKELMLKN